MVESVVALLASAVSGVVALLARHEGKSWRNLPRPEGIEAPLFISDDDVDKELEEVRRLRARKERKGPDRVTSVA
jgi:hypothetical protein